MLAKLNTEASCLKILILTSILITLYALTAGILTYSTALLLDGTLSIFDIAALILSLVTAEILKNAHFTKTYPYGYFKIEPLVVAIQAIFIVAVCLLSLLHSLKDLFHHTAGLKNYGWGFSYTLFTLVVCTIAYLYIVAVNNSKKSPLLTLQALSWKYGAFLTSIILFGFLIAYYFEHSGSSLLNAISHYIDPLMTLTIILFIIKAPVQLFINNLDDLLDRTPLDTSIEQKIHKEIKAIITAQKINIDIESLKIRRAGRAYFISLAYCAPPTTTLRDLEKISLAIEAKLKTDNKYFYIKLIPTLKK